MNIVCSFPVTIAGKDVKISEQDLEPIFPDAGGNNGERTNDVQLVPQSTDSLWIKQFQNKIYFHYSNGNVIVKNLDNGKTWYHKYDIELSAPEIDKTNDKFFCWGRG